LSNLEFLIPVPPFPRRGTAAKVGNDVVRHVVSFLKQVIRDSAPA
jgi:hypothetical protein